MSRTLESRLLNDPRRFSFYQVMRLIESMTPDAPRPGDTGPANTERVRLRPAMALGFPATDVTGVEKYRTMYDVDRYHVTVGFLGLYGSVTPLPVHYTEAIYDTDDPDLARTREFLDLFHHRLLCLLYRIWQKYRWPMQYQPGGRDAFSQRLFPLTGLNKSEKLKHLDQVPLLRYLGLLTQQPRSAEGLRALVSDFFGDVPVRITQCALRHVQLRPDQKNTLGEANCELGVSCILGSRVPDRRGKFRITIGPLSFAQYLSFIPSGENHKLLRELARLYCTDSLEFEMEIILRGDEVPPMELAEDSPAYLGWSGWLTSEPGDDVSVTFQGQVQEMAIIRLAREADFIFQTQAYESDLRIIRFSGQETVSRLFSYKLELGSLDQNVDFDAVVGKPGLLTLYFDDGERFVNGRVLNFEQTKEGTEYTYYEALVVPLFHFLKFRHDIRIFQHKDVRAIIQEVFTDAGIPSDMFRFALQRSHPEREYCVQYRESDWDFVSRLMEEEGIFYFFEHTRENHVLVMGDGQAVLEPIKGEQKILFREASGMVQDQDFINIFKYGQEVRTGAVTQRDFNFKKPRMDLETNETGKKDQSLEFYDYPGLYDNQGDGKELTKTRQEALEATRKHGSGKSNCRRLVPGYKFNLDQHPRSNFNREYLLLSVSMRGAQPQSAGHEAEVQDEEPTFVCDFACVPSDQPYRPQRRIKKPVVEGCQTAIVVGPSGEEIYTDEYGRVKVQFHWDREGNYDEESSCWIRCSSEWAGGRWGTVMLPRIGQEVIVDFLEGDPDRPIITGRVYNGDNRTPYALPDEKTKSTRKSNSSKGGGGFNEIRFEDKKGEEQVFLHAEKDQDLHVKNDRREWVGNERHLIVKKNKRELIGKDSETTIDGKENIQVMKARSVDIGKDFKTAVGGDRSLYVDGDDKTMSRGDRNKIVLGKSAEGVLGKKSSLVLGDDVSVTTGTRSRAAVKESIEFVGISKKTTVGMDLNMQAGLKAVIEAGLELTIRAGCSFIKLDPLGVTVMGPLLLINTFGFPGIARPAIPLVPDIPMPPMPPMWPQEPDEADDGKPGKDKVFKRAPKPNQPEPYQPYPFKVPSWPEQASAFGNQASALKKSASLGSPLCSFC